MHTYEDNWGPAAENELCIKTDFVSYSLLQPIQALQRESWSSKTLIIILRLAIYILHIIKYYKKFVFY